MVAVRASPNASPSAEWIYCLDKRCVDVRPPSRGCYFPDPPCHSAASVAAGGRCVCGAQSRRRHAFVAAHKEASQLYLPGIVNSCFVRFTGVLLNPPTLPGVKGVGGVGFIVVSPHRRSSERWMMKCTWLMVDCLNQPSIFKILL